MQSMKFYPIEFDQRRLTANLLQKSNHHWKNACKWHSHVFWKRKLLLPHRMIPIIQWLNGRRHEWKFQHRSRTRCHLRLSMSHQNRQRSPYPKCHLDRMHSNIWASPNPQRLQCHPSMTMILNRIILLRSSHHTIFAIEENSNETKLSIIQQ